MAKFGKMPIPVGNVKVSVKDNIVSYKGQFASGEYAVPDIFSVHFEENTLFLKLKSQDSFKSRLINVEALWGLHRALLKNTINGAGELFEKKLKIEGLGFKGVLQGKEIVFSLGFSNKLTFEIPDGVQMEVDKTGQLITARSHDKGLLGQACGEIRALRKPDPYKGKGVRYEGEKIRIKVGKK